MFSFDDFAQPLLVFYLLILGAWVLAGVAGILFGAFGKLGSEGPPVWVFVILLVFCSFQRVYVAEVSV